METIQEIISFTKDALSNAAKIDDVIDNAIKPIKDYTDTIGDIAAPVKSLIAMIDLRRRLILKSFITNYAKQLYGEYSINEEETLKLQHFFKHKKNIEYISDIIDSAINSKSLKATAILGAIAGVFIKEKDNLNYNYLSVIESLRIMTDFDIDNFVALYEYLSTIETSHTETEEYRTRDFYDEQNPNQIKLDRNSLEWTIEKLKRTNGLTYNEGGIGQSGNSKGAFEINDTTIELYRLITTTKTV